MLTLPAGMPTRLLFVLINNLINLLIYPWLNGCFGGGGVGNMAVNDAIWEP